MSTWKLGRVFNAAFAQLDGVLVLVYNKGVIRRHQLRAQEYARRVPFPCTASHLIKLSAVESTRLPGAAHGAHDLSRTAWEVLARPNASLQTFGPALRDRPCQDLLNFRGNGPEDARLVQLGARRLVLMHNEYARCEPTAADSASCARQPAGSAAVQDPTPAYRRTMYVREVHVVVTPSGSLEARALAPVLVRPDEAGPSMAVVEKNWAPFTLWEPPQREPSALFFHRFLDLRARAVVQRVDLATGSVQATYWTRNGGLRAAIGCAAHALVSGGTNAVRLNSTHFVAVGHTMTAPCRLPQVTARGEAARDACFARNDWRAYGLFACARNDWRAYGLFAYLFLSEPPFALAGATREFRLELPAASGPVQELGPPTPPVHSPTQAVRSSLPQFPIGLALDRTRNALLLSTGHNDRDTLLSRIDVPFLMRRMVRLRSSRE